MAGGVLYVVATPIGNLEDVTLRALRVLREVDVVAAEDTRRTRILLQHHGIAKPLVAYHDAVERTRAPALVERLRRGERVALVSDAGTPGIADPGYHLVRQALASGVQVVPVPGPSAVAAITSVAGLPVDRFAFEGFLPNRSAARRRRLGDLAREERALVFLEAPTRVVAMLGDALSALGDREVVVGRELTKLHEEILRGRVSEVRAALAARAKVLGELVIVVAGAPDATEGAAPPDLDAHIRRLRSEGLGVRDVAARLAAETGRSRRAIYQRALELERGGAA